MRKNVLRREDEKKRKTLGHWCRNGFSEEVPRCRRLSLSQEGTQRKRQKKIHIWSHVGLCVSRSSRHVCCLLHFRGGSADKKENFSQSTKKVLTETLNLLNCLNLARIIIRKSQRWVFIIRPEGGAGRNENVFREIFYRFFCCPRTTRSSWNFFRSLLKPRMGCVSTQLASITFSVP